MEHTGITGNNHYTVTKSSPTGKRERMANLELLRCVAMMMVVALHYLGKGKLLPDLAGASVGPGGTAAWLLESFCIVAVNVYMFISGYFLGTSSFRLSRLVGLWLQVWAYSVTFGLLGAVTGVMRETVFDTHYLLTLLFPVSMEHYWFMTAYVFLYLLLPFVGVAAGRMTKRQLQTALGLLLFNFCFLKSIFPVRFEMDRVGYDCLWYLCVFLSAVYMRRFGCILFEKKGMGAGLYVGCCMLIFGGTMVLHGIYLRTGSLSHVLHLFQEYNHILPFLAAAGLFAAFYRMKITGRAAGIINRIAPCTLGVYLLHENLGLRYTWQKWLGAEAVEAAVQGGGAVSIAVLLFGTAAAVLCVFACGIAVEMARQGLFRILRRGLEHLSPCRKLFDKIGRTDQAFREE